MEQVMTEEAWVLLDKVQGQLQAEILKGLLEAQGIMVWLNQEGAARAYAVEVGTLGMVEILVPSGVIDKARQVLEAYYRGDFENMEFEEPGPGETPED
jgi:Putative prokaryotic signal transducing protein